MTFTSDLFDKQFDIFSDHFEGHLTLMCMTHSLNSLPILDVKVAPDTILSCKSITTPIRTLVIINLRYRSLFPPLNDESYLPISFPLEGFDANTISV